jgi:methionine transaminase
MRSKLPNTGTTIFATMSKMAAEHDAINLSQGFPNFPVDPVLLDILAKNAHSDAHQYMPMAGYQPLLERISGLIESSYGRKTDTSAELLVTAGATQGIFTAIQALVSAGEEVIVIDPAYDCYDPAITLAGGEPVHVSMREDFTIDWYTLREVVSQRTRMLVINNPHNPSGKVLAETDIAELRRLMNDYPKLLLLSDEVYEFITFGQPHVSAHSFEELRERTIVVSSFGKTFHITGWKVGYLVAPEKLMREIKKVHQFLVFSVNSVAQRSLAEYLDKTDVADLGPFYRQKRDLFRGLLEKSRFELLPSEGTYFQTVRFDAIRDQRDTEFCEWLVKEVGVAAIPLSVFFADDSDFRTIRFCFAKTDETLIAAGEKLCRI